MRYEVASEEGNVRDNVPFIRQDVKELAMRRLTKSHRRDQAEMRDAVGVFRVGSRTRHRRVEGACCYSKCIAYSN